MSKQTDLDRVESARWRLAEARDATRSMKARVMSYLWAWCAAGDVESAGRYGKEATTIMDTIVDDLTSMLSGHRTNPKASKRMATNVGALVRKALS